MTSPPERSQTERAAIRDVISAGPVSAREISQLVGLAERVVLAHLQEIAKGRPGLTIEAPRCQGCGFSFEARARMSRPSRCPKCRAERISAPRFALK